MEHFYKKTYRERGTKSEISSTIHYRIRNGVIMEVGE